MAERQPRQWIYRDCDGEPVIRVTRIDTDGRKSFRQEAWIDGQWEPNLKNLPPEAAYYPYGMERFAADGAQQVVFVEGEKCVDALAAVLPEEAWCPLTLIGGAQRAGNLACVIPDLTGLEVTLWPDNDTAGKEVWLDELIPRLQDAGAAWVGVVQLPEHWPPKFDCADLLEPLTAPGCPEEVRLGLAREVLDVLNSAQPAVGGVRPTEPVDPGPQIEGRIHPLLWNAIRWAADGVATFSAPVNLALVCAGATGCLFDAPKLWLSPTHIVPTSVWVVLVGSSSSGKSPLLEALVEDRWNTVAHWFAELNRVLAEEVDQQRRKAQLPVLRRFRHVTGDGTAEGISRVTATNASLPDLQAQHSELRSVAAGHARVLPTALIQDELTQLLLPSGGRDAAIRVHGTLCRLYDGKSSNSARADKERDVLPHSVHFLLLGGIQPGLMDAVTRATLQGLPGRIAFLSMPRYQPPEGRPNHRRIDDARRDLEEIYRYVVNLRLQRLRLSPEAEALAQKDNEANRVEGDSAEGIKDQTLGKFTARTARFAGALAVLDYVCDLIDRGADPVVNPIEIEVTTEHYLLARDVCLWCNDQAMASGIAPDTPATVLERLLPEHQGRYYQLSLLRRLYDDAIYGLPNKGDLALSQPTFEKALRKAGCTPLKGKQKAHPEPGSAKRSVSVRNVWQVP